MKEQPEFYDGRDGCYVTYDAPGAEHYGRGRPQHGPAMFAPMDWRQDHERLTPEQYQRRAERAAARVELLQHEKDQAVLDATQAIYRAGGRSWDECTQMAEGGAFVPYMKHTDPSVLVSHAEAEADDEAKRTERDQARLDLTQELARYGYGYDEAARLANQHAGRLSGGQHTAAGLARELAAARR